MVRLKLGFPRSYSAVSKINTILKLHVSPVTMTKKRLYNVFSLLSGADLGNPGVLTKCHKVAEASYLSCEYVILY